MIELLIFSSSAGLGIICGIFLYRFVSIKKHDQQVVLGNVKYELNNLYFEKSVALEALGKIKQFFEDKKIDEYERDRLSIPLEGFANEPLLLYLSSFTGEILIIDDFSCCASDLGECLSPKSACNSAVGSVDTDFNDDVVVVVIGANSDPVPSVVPFLVVIILDLFLSTAG